MNDGKDFRDEVTTQYDQCGRMIFHLKYNIFTLEAIMEDRSAAFLLGRMIEAAEGEGDCPRCLFCDAEFALGKSDPPAGFFLLTTGLREKNGVCGLICSDCAERYNTSSSFFSAASKALTKSLGIALGSFMPKEKFSAVKQ